MPEDIWVVSHACQSNLSTLVELWDMAEAATWIDGDMAVCTRDCCKGER